MCLRITYYQWLNDLSLVEEKKCKCWLCLSFPFVLEKWKLQSWWNVTDLKEYNKKKQQKNSSPIADAFIN